ncbi:hypothetical protein [Limnoglobus roseus]|uniref:Uncharacterized protein n=1 Tax=Limnoglobus roseus TaxID=2598579 RepID=A0A5C1AQ85_9BACT|nr:hypothetical protein [Limnoglobus roseus]QEL19334.1 hypothetical protein PX52LOC_06403 [Limnoglobus roseus]
MADTKISALTDGVAGVSTDMIVIVRGGVNYRLTLVNLLSGMGSVTQLVTPTNGSTVNVTRSNYTTLLVNPAGPLLSLTINMPSSPQDGDRVSISSGQAITTVNQTGGTILSALTTMLLGGFATHVFNAAANKWFRIG